MALIQGNPDQIATIIKDGIAATLEERIKSKLMEIVDPIVSQVARDLAQQTAVAVKSYMHIDPKEFGPVVQVALLFNNQRVNYEAAGSSERAHVGRTVGSAGQGASTLEQGGSDC